MLDGIRPELYDRRSLETAQHSYFGLMRTALIAKAERARFQVLDMQPLFRKDFAARGKKFEFESNAHWNEEGHRVFATAVLSSTIWNDLFPPAGAAQ